MAIDKTVFRQNENQRLNEMSNYSMDVSHFERCELLRDLNFRGLMRKDEAMEAPHLTRYQIAWLRDSLISDVHLISPLLNEAGERIAACDLSSIRDSYNQEAQPLSYIKRVYLEFLLLDRFGIRI